MKKGVMITLGMLLLASIVFSLGVLVFHNTAYSNERFAELALFDRVYELDSSVSSNLKRIFEYESGMSVTVKNNSVELGETIPRTTNYASVMENYRDYIENTYNTSLVLKFDNSVFNSVKNQMPLLIKPHGILYTHDVSGDSDWISITPESTTSVLNYTFKINTTADAITMSWYTTPGGKTITVTANYKNGQVTQTNAVAMTGVIAVNMTYTNPPAQADGIMLLLLPPESITVSRGTNHVGVETVLALNAASDQTTVSYPDNMYNITFQDSNITKTSTPRIA